MRDTHPEAERVQIELMRKAGPARRGAIACDLTDSVVAMSKAAIARSHPQLSESERELFFIDLCYGRQLAEWVRRLKRASAPT